MTIGKGEPWGEETGLVPDRVAVDDAELAALAAAGTGAVLAVRAGDVRRTLGLGEATGPDAVRTPALAYPFDLGTARLDDGTPVPFAAHLVARRRWWAGEFAVALNVGWRGHWYLGPRAHPNDGLLDVIHGSLGARQRLEARRRLPSGTHLPHPDLRVLRVAAWHHRFPRPVTVSADGVTVGTTRELEVVLAPDCFTVVA